MGVSFKVAKVGTRFRPKPFLIDENDDGFKDKSSSHREEEQQQDTCSKKRVNEGGFIGAMDHTADYSNSLVQSGLHQVSRDLEVEVSFSLNLFPDGFSIGNPTEGMLLPLRQGAPNMLLPYNRASETLFSAIEYGFLPGDSFDDIPCKYVDGTIACEVRDYRKGVPKSGITGKPPIVHKVLLQMSMENVVKDISSISNDSWTYDNLLKLESRILKSLQPKLHLGPTPLLERLCGMPVSRKLNLGMLGGRKRTRQNNAPEVNLIPNNLTLGNDISFFHLLENSKSHSSLELQSAVPCAQQNFSRAFQNTEKNSIPQHSICSRSLSTATTTIPSNFVSMPEQDLTDSYVRMRNPSALLIGKRGRSEAHSSHSPNVKRPKQKLLDLVQVQPKTIFGGVPRLEASMPSYLSCRGVQCSVKEKLTKTDTLYKPGMGKIKDDYHIMGEKEQSKHLQSQVQRFIPQVFASGTIHSPASSQSGNFSAMPVVGLRETDTLKRRSNSSKKTQSGVVSQTSVSNVNGPFSANSPSTGTSPLILSSMTEGRNQVLDRLLEIKRVSQRCGLNLKKCKHDRFLQRKSFSHVPEVLAFQLSESNKMSLNVCKTRVMVFTRPRHVYQCNDIPIIVNETQNKVVISEKSKDGMVEVCVLYGDEEESNPVLALPNTNTHYADLFTAQFTSLHYADLFAAQFASLMKHEGYQLTDDQIQPTDASTIRQPSAATSVTLEDGEAEVSRTLISGNSSTIKQQSALKSVTPENGEAKVPQTLISSESPYMLPISSNISFLSPQQLQSQCFSILIGNTCNSLGNSGIHRGNQIMNNHPDLQFQLQKRRMQQLLQRNVGSGNLVDIGSMSNILGMGGNVGQINTLSSQVSSFGNPSQSQGRGIPSGLSMGWNSSVEEVGGMVTGNSPLMHGGSLLDQANSRGGMAQLQLVGMTPMGPPNISATNFNRNNQQQQLRTSPQMLQQEQLDQMQQMRHMVNVPGQVDLFPTQQISGQRQMRLQTAPQQGNAAVSVMRSPWNRG